ncbi:MAG: membrane protein insertase YidC [Elusimicrobiota bacterium]
MEKRTFLAIVLSIAILIGWQWLFGPKKRITSTNTPVSAVDDTRKTAKSALQSPSIPSASIDLSTKQAKTFQIKTDKAIYVLSENEASIVNCFIKEERLNEKTSVELVLDGKLLNDRDSGIWSNIPVKNQPYQTKFGRFTSDFYIEKTFCFSNDSYLIDIKYTILNKTKFPKVFDGLSLAIGPGLGTDAKEMKENKRLLRTISYSHKKVEKLKFGGYQFSSKWVGIDNRYFLSVFCQTTDGFKIVISSDVEKMPLVFTSTSKIEFSPSEKKSFSITSYTGPKGFSRLKGIKIGNTKLQLEKAVDFGFFGDLGEIALAALNFLYKITHNYGWAIVIISIFLNIVFFPLSKKQFASAQAMKSIQNEVKALQIKYKSDPKKMNAEVWSLYKSKGVNPFSGCLPMLIQLPIFWALFTMLRNAYELRGAQWVLWIADLSTKDPYYVLPVLMGAGMFLQQWMSTSTADPTQKQMMIMMPIIFTVMFLGFPSGLVIYWLTNSVVTIIEQWLIFEKTS